MRCERIPTTANNNAQFIPESEADERTPLLKAEASSGRPVSDRFCGSQSDEEAFGAGEIDKGVRLRERPRNVAGVILILLIGEFFLSSFADFRVIGKSVVETIRSLEFFHALMALQASLLRMQTARLFWLPVGLLAANSMI